MAFANVVITGRYVALSIAFGVGTFLIFLVLAERQMRARYHLGEDEIKVIKPHITSPTETVFSYDEIGGGNWKEAMFGTNVGTIRLYREEMEDPAINLHNIPQFTQLASFLANKIDDFAYKKAPYSDEGHGRAMEEGHTGRDSRSLHFDPSTQWITPTRDSTYRGFLFSTVVGLMITAGLGYYTLQNGPSAGDALITIKGIHLTTGLFPVLFLFIASIQFIVRAEREIQSRYRIGSDGVQKVGRTIFLRQYTSELTFDEITGGSLRQPPEGGKGGTIRLYTDVDNNPALRMAFIPHAEEHYRAIKEHVDDFTEVEIEYTSRPFRPSY